MMRVMQKRAGPGATDPRSIPTACTTETAERYRKAKQPTSRVMLRATRQDGTYFFVSGQIAKALIALVHAGAAGVTAQEVASWAYRFAAYVHTLRTIHSLPIETLHEPHDNGWHGRYVLHEAIAIGRLL